MFSIVVALCLIALSAAYMPSNRLATGVSRTKLFEDFNMDWSNPSGLDSNNKVIFTERQLREFTEAYSEDKRTNPIEWLFGLFKKDDGVEGMESNLKSTVSLQLLEEKTASYVTGKSDAKAFYATLTSAFGEKLPTVLPEILSSLPAAKAAALKKLIK